MLDEATRSSTLISGLKQQQLDVRMEFSLASLDLLRNMGLKAERDHGPKSLGHFETLLSGIRIIQALV